MHTWSMVDVLILVAVIWGFISYNLYRLWLPAMLTATTQPVHGMDNGISKSLKLCFGSVTFWYGSGSSSFCEWPSDADKKGSFAYCFVKVHLHHSSKIKSQKEPTKKEIKIFRLMLEGSGSRSIPMNNGSESGTLREFHYNRSVKD